MAHPLFLFYKIPISVQTGQALPGPEEVVSPMQLTGQVRLFAD